MAVDTRCTAGAGVLIALGYSLSILLRAEMTEASLPKTRRGGRGGARQGGVGQAPEGMEPWGTANAWRGGGGGRGG